MQEIDLSKIEPILQEYKGGKGALIPILQKVQEEFGYLPKEALYKISKKTKTPISKIYGVVTFYAQFYLTPRGRNIVRVCRGTACHVRGGKSVKETVEKTLEISEGETTPDYKFTLETVACLGACALAPVMVINNAYYGKMTQSKIRTLISKI